VGLFDKPSGQAPAQGMCQMPPVVHTNDGQYILRTDDRAGAVQRVL